MSKVVGSHASRRTSAMVARPSVRRSVLPPNRSNTSLPSSVCVPDIAEGGFDGDVPTKSDYMSSVLVVPMAGLIVDDGQEYVTHDYEDDEEDVDDIDKDAEGCFGEQTIEEYIALLQRQRHEELGGDGDDVASHLLSQVLGDGSLGGEDEDEDDDTSTGKGKKESSSKRGGSFGGFFRSKSTSVPADDDDDEDEDDDDILDTTENNVNIIISMYV